MNISEHLINKRISLYAPFCGLSNNAVGVIRGFTDDGEYNVEFPAKFLEGNQGVNDNTVVFLNIDPATPHTILTD